MKFFFLLAAVFVFAGSGCGDAYITSSSSRAANPAGVIIPGNPVASGGQVTPLVNPSINTNFPFQTR